MVKYVGTVVVPFARERVAKLMADWTNLSVWDLNITKSVLAAGQKEGQAGVGTHFDCAFNLNGKDIDVAYECLVYDMPSRCEFRGLATLFESRDKLSFEEVDMKSTAITAEFNLSFRGLLSPFSFVMGGVMQKTGPIVMKDIDKFVTESLADKQ